MLKQRNGALEAAQLCGHLAEGLEAVELGSHGHAAAVGVPGEVVVLVHVQPVPAVGDDLVQVLTPIASRLRTCTSHAITLACFAEFADTGVEYRPQPDPVFTKDARPCIISEKISGHNRIQFS